MAKATAGVSRRWGPMAEEILARLEASDQYLYSQH